MHWACSELRSAMVLSNGGNEDNVRKAKSVLETLEFLWCQRGTNGSLSRAVRCYPLHGLFQSHAEASTQRATLLHGRNSRPYNTLEKIFGERPFEFMPHKPFFYDSSFFYVGLW